MKKAETPKLLLKTVKLSLKVNELYFSTRSVMHSIGSGRKTQFLPAPHQGRTSHEKLSLWIWGDKIKEKGDKVKFSWRTLALDFRWPPPPPPLPPRRNGLEFYVWRLLHARSTTRYRLMDDVWLRSLCKGYYLWFKSITWVGKTVVKTLQYTS